MADPRVEGWKQAGTLCLWRYRGNYKNYPGWNLASDEAGWQAIFDFLERMAASALACRRGIKVSRPAPSVLAVPNNPARESGIESPSLLNLIAPGGKVEGRHWKLKSDAAQVSLEVGTDKLGELREAVRRTRSNGGDFAIGPDEKSSWKEASVWFWLIPTM
jgi:hypothetical protein